MTTECLLYHKTQGEIVASDKPPSIALTQQTELWEIVRFSSSEAAQCIAQYSYKVKLTVHRFKVGDLDV